MPITTSLAFVVASAGDVVVVAELPLPFPCTSSGDAVATPDHSETFIASDFVVPAAKLAVTLVTDGAATRYHISTRVFAPLRKPIGPFVQVPALESVTDASGPVLPAAIATVATRVSPDADAVIGTVNEAAELALPVFCCWRTMSPEPPPRQPSSPCS